MNEKREKRPRERKYKTTQYNKMPVLALLAREILPIHHAGINLQESEDGWFRKLW